MSSGWPRYFPLAMALWFAACAVWGLSTGIGTLRRKRWARMSIQLFGVALVFFILPADETIRHENVLKDGEIVAEVSVPASAFSKRSTYMKFKERESLDFAMSSVAAVIELAPNKTVSKASIVLGGVASIPWRVPV